jgi:hypothetical protein
MSLTHQLMLDVLFHSNPAAVAVWVQGKTTLSRHVRAFAVQYLGHILQGCDQDIQSQNVKADGHNCLRNVACVQTKFI